MLMQGKGFDFSNSILRIKKNLKNIWEKSNFHKTFYQVKGKKCKRIWIPPENELNHEVKVYVIFALSAFFTCYCIPAIANQLVIPYLLGKDLMEFVELADNRIKI